MNLNPLQKITDNPKMRTGTKFVIINWVVTMLIIIFVTVGLSLLSIKWEILIQVIRELKVSNIIIALLGQSGVSTIANSLRIAIENKANNIKINKNNGE